MEQGGQEVCLLLLAGPFYTFEPSAHLLVHLSALRVRIHSGWKKCPTMSPPAHLVSLSIEG